MEFKPKKEYVAAMLGNGEKFVIPDYQRPYRWGQDECETLWKDILEVFGDGEKEIEEYFLGSVVVFRNEENQLEIIDGQQRITTFTLLFRAFYEHFAREDTQIKDDYTRDFGKCIWQYDRNKGFRYEAYLTSKVATANDNEVLKELLSANYDKVELEKLNSTSNEAKQSKFFNSNYANNFLFFYDSIANFKLAKASKWLDFCDLLLGEKLFLLLVECDSQESAMTIFNTLNSRGMPLSNADILKGYLYKSIQGDREKHDFAQRWKNLEEKIEQNSNIKNLDFLFLQYMHIIRAENNDKDTTTPSILDFFTKDDSNIKKSKKIHYGTRGKWLYKKETMDFIEKLSDFWCSPKDYLSDKSARYISILDKFQNKSWQSFVSCLVYRNQENMQDTAKFSKEFDEFLPLLIKLITLPMLHNQSTTNVIDGILFNLNVSLKQGKLQEVKTNFLMPSQVAFDENTNTNGLKKYLLYLYAYVYDNFSQDLEYNLEIEHILPRQWQNANFNDWNEESHKEYIERIGNKILLPKKPNIKCSDNFFAKKQEEYKKCENLKEVYELGVREKHTWDKEDIEDRGAKIYYVLLDFLKI